MGDTVSSFSPSPAEHAEPCLRLHCERTPPIGFFLVCPAIDCYEQGVALGPALKNTGLGEWSAIRPAFLGMRPPDGSFSVMDPAQRLYPVRDMPGEIEIYYCSQLHCAAQPDLAEHRGSVVVVEVPPEPPAPPFGTVLFRRLLGEDDPPPDRRRRVKILSFDEQGRVVIVDVPRLKVELHVQ